MSDDKQEIMEVPVEVTMPVQAEEEVIREMKRQGAIEVPEKTLSTLAKIGIFAQGVGTLRIQRGRTLINQNRAEQIMIALQEEFNEIRAGKRSRGRLTDLLSVADSIGNMMRRVTESQKLALEMEAPVPANGGTPANPDDVPNNVGFLPGTKVEAGGTVIMANEVHLRAEPKKALPPG